MINSASSLVSVIATLKNRICTPESGGSDAVFLQLLQALNQPLSGTGNVPGSIFPARPNDHEHPGDSEGTLLSSASGEDGAEVCESSVPRVKKDKGVGCVDVEMILGLLSAAAYQIQQNQASISDKNAPDFSHVRDERPGRDGRTTGLAGTLLDLLNQGSSSLLELLSARQGVPQRQWIYGPDGDRQHEAIGKADGIRQLDTVQGQKLVPQLIIENQPLLDGQSGIQEQQEEGMVQEAVVLPTPVNRPVAASHPPGTPGAPRLRADNASGGKVGSEEGNLVLRHRIDARDFGEVHPPSNKDESGPNGIALDSSDSAETELPSHSDPESHGRILDSLAAPRGPIGAGAISSRNVQAPETARLPGGAVRDAVVEQIVSRAHLILARGRAGLSIELEPRELGRVQVHVSVGSDGLQVKLVAEASDTREIIQASLPQLKATFESQGIRVEGFDVGGSSGFSGFPSPQGNAQGHGPSNGNSAVQYFENGDADGVEGKEGAELRAQDSLVDYRI